MYRPRRIETHPDWLDPDGIKVYTISFTGKPVEQAPFEHALEAVKGVRTVDWPTTAAFAIFHEGESARYLVLVYWGNDNELFTLVSVETAEGWTVDPERYSFCLWDLEVLWQERQNYIEHCYSDEFDLNAYRRARPSAWL